MHTIERRPSELVLTFQGLITNVELNEWTAQSRSILALGHENLGLIVDLRELVRLQPDAETIVSKIRTVYNRLGNRRTAVVVTSSFLTSRLRRLAAEARADDNERYINVATTTNWHEAAVQWVRRGVEHTHVAQGRKH